MPDTSTDFDFISIDDLDSEERQASEPKKAPKRKPVQLPLPQASLNARRDAGARRAPKPAAGRRPKPPEPAMPSQNAGKSRMVIVQRRRKRSGSEPALAAAMGVLLIAVAVGMYLYFPLAATAPPPKPNAPQVFKVPPLPEPPPAPEIQATVSTGAPLERDLNPYGVTAATAVEPAAVAQVQQADLEKSVADFLNTWRIAWENTAGQKSALGPYLECYAPGFTHAGMDRAAWMADKGQKNQRKDWIRVRLSDIRVGVPAADDTVNVTFFQNYASSNYTEASEKTLLLKKSGTSWQILAIEQQ